MEHAHLVIKPSIGRIVHFQRIATSPGHPLAAIVTSVSHDGRVNLTVFDGAGGVYGAVNVPFVQPSQDLPNSAYAEWPTFQRQSSEEERVIATAKEFFKDVDTGDQQEAPEEAAKEVVMGPRVTQARIDKLIVGEYYVNAYDAFQQAPLLPALKNLTLCVLVLKNGFTVTGESACVDYANFDADIGRRIAREHAVNKVWQLEGYLLKDFSSKLTKAGSFGAALDAIDGGWKVAREGWNDKGMWIALQTPDYIGGVNKPYIYMRTADSSMVPWLASQTDMLARDWVLVE